jgi:flagellar M-ring protein FliF
MDSSPSLVPAVASPSPPAPAPAGLPARLAVLGQLRPAQIATLAATALALLAFFGFMIARALEPAYTLLYGELELADSAQIVSRLEAAGVPFELQQGGAAILVPADQATRLRMTLAEEGLPRGGIIGDEIFDHASALGTTSFLQNVNLRRALEGELARTIGALADVRSARVHLVLPQRELFRREQLEPSASVTLVMRGARRLDRRQILAIQHLVAAAVPGLRPDRIALVDNHGTLLARGGEGPAESQLASQADEYRIAHESRLKQVIEQLLERSLGPGRVHAEVAAEVDFDQVTLTEEIFDPDSQVARSTQTIEEDSESAARERAEEVSVANNLPNLAANDGAGQSSSEASKRTEETVNYEISRTVRNHTQIGGRIKRLSVAVLVDGRPDAGAPDAPSPPDLEALALLVRSAIGFDAKRGDVVEVRYLPFAAPAEEEAAASWFAPAPQDLMLLVKLLLLAGTGLLAMLLVVRPALARLLPPQGAGTPPSPPDQLGAGEAATLPAPADVVDGSGTDAEAAAGGPRQISVDQIDAPIRADLIQEARALIEQQSDQAAAVVRAWLDEERAARRG